MEKALSFSTLIRRSLVFFDAYSPLDGRISFNRRDVAERHAEALAEALRKAQEREWENR